MIAPQACRDLRRWFCYYLLPPSRSLLALLGTLRFPPGPAAIFVAGFFTICFLTRGLSWLSWGPLVLSQHLGTRYDCSPGPPRSSPLVFLQLLPGPAVIFAAGLFTTCFLARGLSWLSWGPRVLS